MFEEQYRRDNDRLHAREDLLMEIQKKAKRPAGNGFLRYGAAAAAVVLIAAGTVGIALSRTPNENAASPAAASVVSAETAGTENGTLASYDELYGLLMESRSDTRDMAMADGMQMEVAAEEVAAAADEPAAEAPAAAAEMASTTSAPEAGGGYSETNVQVAGIDEADIVKTDGNYIYYLTDDTLIITRANGDKSRVVSKTALFDRDGAVQNNYYWGAEMYVSGDRLAVILQGSRSAVVRGGDWYSETTGAVLYNIADRANPKRISVIEQSGAYVSSRMSEGFVYLVTTQYVYQPIKGEPITFAPALWRDGTAETVAVSDILVPDRTRTDAYTVIGSFDIANGTDYASVKAVLGNAGEIYMNAAHLLIAAGVDDTSTSEIAPDATGKNVQVTTSASKTRLLLFDIGKGSIQKRAEGEVAGTLLNQFAMDEYDGVFRIVTTVSSWTQKIYTDGVDTYEYEDENSNALFTLDADLKPMGSIENLAKDEWVESVRFDGEIAYFVTFRRIDPLFTVDLSDPAKPAILSTLKIPGFSEYLHVYGDGRLLGVGYAADEETGWTQGVKLSMFDTTDKADVRELSTKVIAADWTAVGSNHKAILVSPEKALIAFPADDCYYVFTYSDAEGFVQRGKLQQDGGWGDRLRGVFIGNDLYVCSQTGITVIALSDASIVYALTY